MCKEHKFFRCKHCGNIVGMISQLGSSDYLLRRRDGRISSKYSRCFKREACACGYCSWQYTVLVEVGSVAHPMEENHFIQWIYLSRPRMADRENVSLPVKNLRHPLRLIMMK